MWKVFTGLLLFAIILFLPDISGLSRLGQNMAAVAVLMAFWWVTEAVPISATALLPLVLFPLLGIMDMRQAAAPFASHLIFLFLGGFFIAVALQRWNLHKRIALTTVWIIGFSQTKLLLGFMLATAFLSMWISNTATTMIMVPIGIAVADSLADKSQSTAKSSFPPALMLGTAYAASIGGIGTLIGTPPNIVFANTLEGMYGIQITFGNWMKIGLPLVIIFLPLTWLYLSRMAYKLEKKSDVSGKDVIRQEIASLGKLSIEEKCVGVVFALTVLLWLFSTPKEIGPLVIPGVQSIFPQTTDATIAMFGALLLFIIPASKKSGSRRILVWKDAKQIPWGILLLFGGGLSLAKGFETTGLAKWIGSYVEILADAPHILLAVAVITMIIFLTELTSNTATTAMILPILAGVAEGIGENPVMLMAPAAIAASCAFMLPVATPPNAIVFGSGYLSIPTMAKRGLFLNIVGIILITLLTYTIIGTAIDNAIR